MGCTEHHPLDTLKKKIDAKNVDKKFKYKGHVLLYEYTKNRYGLTDTQWHFLFSSLFLYDNTIEGFTKRVRYLLDGNKIPEDWKDRIRNRDLFYRN